MRPEQPRDVEAIDSVLRACFPTTAEAQLVRRLREASRLPVSWVAENVSQVIGHIAFSPVTAVDGQQGAGLAPLAVLEEDRRQGIGGELVRVGLDACRTLGYGWCVVLGDPHYYFRFGFRPASEFGLNSEFHGGDAFQGIELIPGSIPIRAGLVRYAPEFASFA